MPLALYDLPNWVFGLLISSSWVLIGLGGHLVFQRLCRVGFAEAERNLAIAMLAVIATITSLLLAFSAISVWESFGSADKAVRGEAITMGALARDLAVYDSAESRQTRDLLRRYAAEVIEQEWPAMRRGQSDDPARVTFDEMFRSAGRIEPHSPREAALMPEIWARTNELIKYRRERLYASEARVPATLWTVVVVATLLTLATTWVLPRTAFNLAAAGLLSCAFGLVFFFIAAMDRPFAGKESIGPEPFESTLLKMGQWDQQTKLAGATAAAAK